MNKAKPLQIDVEKIIKEKNPKLLKRLPKFIIRYLKRIVHQEEINEFLKENSDYKDLDFVDTTLKHMDILTEIHGFDNIPNTGRFVFVANHPLGGLESMVFMREVAKKHPNIKFPVNDILMALENLHGIFVPLNKLGTQSKEAAQKLDEVFYSDAQILFFPAGLCSRKIKGKIVDLKWRKTFVAKAVKSNRDIIPVYIDGKNSNFFYNLSNFRRFLGVKTNIEMLYLADEMLKQRGQTIKIRFGKPFPCSKIDNSKNYSEWADYFKAKTYELDKSGRL
jgi:putative hemolysin